ncbi:hypothetical protein MIR68_005550 [Amoeboaphelidium protococcarum]|nr:hypothetical protein MIR68_005550 [Amoeboaphelidium protococcarum]
MSDSWEDQLDDQPIAVAEGAYANDQDDDVLDSWEDELEDESADTKVSTVAPPKKKKPLAQAIEERKQAEEKKRQEIAEKKAQMEAELMEDPLERKKRLEQAVREADMQHATDLFSGVTLSSADAAAAAAGALDSKQSIDSMHPTSKEDFEQFADLIVQKVASCSAKPSVYAQFLDTLYRNLALNLDPIAIRKLSSTLNTLANDKQRQEKDKGKKKSTAKSQLKVSADPFGASEALYDRDDDYDDFM